MGSSSHYYPLLDSSLPADAHIRATNRLFLSITHFPSLRNVIISQFPSRHDLIQALMASCAVPVIFFRDLPSTEFGKALDGFFSRAQPIQDIHTVR